MASETAANGTVASVLPDSSRLFPAQDWVYNNRFDDGTAPHAPLLQYLPATLADNISWQQTSGSDVVQFWLRRTQTCADADNPTATKVTSPCWDLEVLNRGQKQRFFFVEGAGVMAASLLAPASPASSYHKQASLPSPAPLPPNRDALLAQADQQGGFAASEIAATEPLTPAHTHTLLQSALTVVPMEGPSPVYLLGALGVPVSKPVPRLAAEIRWPDPEDVLEAAFFARWHNLKDELPLFFATPEAADRLLRQELPRPLRRPTGGSGVQPGQVTG